MESVHRVQSLCYELKKQAGGRWQAALQVLKRWSLKKKMNETLKNKIPFYTGEDRNWCAATVHAFDLLNR